MCIKKFQYDKLLYFIDVKLTSIFCIVIIFACNYLFFSGVFHDKLILFVAFVALYTVWNNFIAKSTTQEIEITDEAVYFKALGRVDKYLIDDISELKIREFPTAGKLYIRINNYNLFKGRYWVQFKKFDESKVLFKELLDLEYRIKPNTLKARARRVNTKYIELEKQMDIKKAK